MTFRMPFLPPEAMADEPSLLALAGQGVVLARNGDTRAALALALQARARAQDLGSLRGEAHCLATAAVVHLIRGDAICAVAATLDAAPLAVRLGDRALAGHLRVSAEMASVVLGAGHEAACRLRDVVEQAVAMREHALEIRARVGLGVVLGDTERFAAAEEEFERALALSRRRAAVTTPARIVANQANLHRKRAMHAERSADAATRDRECDLAIVAADRANRLAAAEGSGAVQIDALAIAGCARRMRGDGDVALELLGRSIALGRERRTRTATAWVLCERGDLLLDRGELEAAGAAFRDAFDLACDVRPSRKIAVACEGLARVAQARGDAVEAQRWQEARRVELEDFARRAGQTLRSVEACALAA